ncbi:hypothetical protein [Legionella lansingensis]|nr:hypothetical protein [Legionella lansingensis]
MAKELQMACRWMSKIIRSLCVFLLCSTAGWTACSIINESNEQAPKMNDVLGLLLTEMDSCPKDVFALRELLKQLGLKLDTTMVANRGFHNPSQGSFSLFEMVSGNAKLTTATTVSPGEFFFGHFTAVDDANHLIADQNPVKDSLMIEALAWDQQKRVFNFYELRGEGEQGQWFYRGDSQDIFADNEWLHRQEDPFHPKFGRRLRCSGCHGAGGPIMKELDSPHNDWWEPNRKLDFGGREADKKLAEILETLVPPDYLAKNVVIGLRKLLDTHSSQQQSLSLQEQLRPLFCPVELNLASDSATNDENKDEVIIPTGFFVDERLVDTPITILVARAFYQLAYKRVGSNFPETNLEDADHAWLTPVKARSDRMAIDALIARGVIDDKFVADVLGIDMTNPVFSSIRCQLLRFLPELSFGWREKFIANLVKSSEPVAHELAQNLVNPELTPRFYRARAQQFLENCRIKLKNPENVAELYKLLVQRRKEIRTSEISANPRGQILEPGFRVIFPESEIEDQRKLTLTLDCHVEEEA